MQRTVLPLVAALALGGTSSAQILIMTNSTSDTLVSFSPFDGSVINASMFAIPNTVQVSAIDVNGEIWISEQTGDRITRRDMAGNVLGIIGPTFTGGGLDNIRGMARIGNTVYVTNSGTVNGAPGNAIVMFDTAGNFLSTFTTQTLATSPFSALAFQGDLLVAGSSNDDDVYRFTLAGAPVATFHDSTAINFAHQLALASDGNVFCAGFTTGGITKLDAATGSVLSSFTASGARGVFELGNGNIMWTNSSGAHVYDVTAQTSTVVLAGGSYHLNLYGAIGAARTTPYGTACGGIALSASGLPIVNTTINLVTSNISPSAPFGGLGLGFVKHDPGLSLAGIGMAGCFQHNELLAVLLFFPAGASSVSIPFAVPNFPGIPVQVQSVIYDPTGGVTALGAVSSGGIELLLGN